MAAKVNRLTYPELTDAHRIFLRLLIAKGYLSRVDAEALLATVLADFPDSCAGLTYDLTLQRVVDALAGALFDVDMSVMWVRSEADGLAYVVFANTSADEASKAVSTGDDKEAMVTLMKAVTNCLTQTGGKLDKAALLATDKGSLFDKQAQYITDIATEGRAKVVVKKLWLPTALRLLAQGWLECARVEIRSSADEEGGGGGGGGGGAGASESKATRGTFATHANRIFLGPRALAEISLQLNEKGVADECDVCHAPCISPDPKMAKGEVPRRVHYACANLTAQTFPDPVVVPAAPEKGGKQKKARKGDY